MWRGPPHSPVPLKRGPIRGTQVVFWSRRGGLHGYGSHPSEIPADSCTGCGESRRAPATGLVGLGVRDLLVVWAYVDAIGAAAIQCQSQSSTAPPVFLAPLLRYHALRSRLQSGRCHKAKSIPGSSAPSIPTPPTLYPEAPSRHPSSRPPPDGRFVLPGRHKVLLAVSTGLVVCRDCLELLPRYDEPDYTRRSSRQPLGSPRGGGNTVVSRTDTFQPGCHPRPLLEQ